MRELIVKVKRGLNVRKSPVIADNNIIGQMTYNSRFYAETLRRIPPLWWAQDKNGQWIVVANGRNLYVEQTNGKPLPLG